MRQRRVFTLIELLVVIAIIALLMGVLMPAINRARIQAKTAACQAQLRQWGLVWRMFTDDTGGFFSESLEWVYKLRPYYIDGRLRLCPMATRTIVEGAEQPYRAWGSPELVMYDNDRPVGVYKGSYGLNAWVTRSTAGSREPERLWRSPNVRGAAEVPLFLDGAGGDFTPRHEDEPPEFHGEVYIAYPINVNEIRNCCIERHPMGINGLFLDFSVRGVGLKELWELRWHRNWNADRAPPPEWPPWMRKYRDYSVY
jgi:prepilin-type N-terminal cleavage/methylation domain-containing protein